MIHLRLCKTCLSGVPKVRLINVEMTTRPKVASSQPEGWETHECFEDARVKFELGRVSVKIYQEVYSHVCASSARSN